MKRLAPAILCLLLMVIPVGAQDKEGKAAVRELLNLAGAEQQYQQTLTLTAEGMKEEFEKSFSKSIQGQSLSKENQSKAREIFNRHLQSFLTDYHRFIGKTMPWERLVEEIYTPLYLKHFTIEELRAVIAFYKTPEGRKFSEKGSLLMQESSQAVNARYGNALSDYASKQSTLRVKQAMEELKKLGD